MSSPEIPPPGLSDEEAASVNHIATSCAQTIETIIAAAEQGPLDPSTESEIGHFMLTRAQAAAQTNDHAAFEACLGRLCDLVGDDPERASVVVNSCLAGIAIGNEAAFAKLTETIELEKAQLEARMLINPDSFLYAPDYAYSAGTAMANLFSGCISEKFPPAAWIEKVATNHLHSWVLHMEYFKQLESKDYATAETVRPTIEALAARLLDRTAFPDPFVLSQTADAIRAVRDPGLCQQLITLFLDTYDRTPPDTRTDINSYLCLMSTCQEFLNSKRAYPPTDTEDAIADKINDTLQAASDTQWETGYFTSIEEELLKWWVASEKYKGVTPLELVSFMNECATELLRSEDSAPPEAHSSGAIISLIDKTLASYAQLSAKQGDLEGARVYISSMASEDARLIAFNTTLRYIQTPEDLQALKPDEILLQTDPLLFHQFQTAAAMLSRNPDALVDAVLATAAILDHKYNAWLYDIIKKAHQTLVEIDEQRATALARQLVDVLIGKEQDYTNIYPYAELLIRSGDIQELFRAYDELQRMRSSLHRFNRTYRLADAITQGFGRYIRPESTSTYEESAPPTTSDPIAALLRKIIENLE